MRSERSVDYSCLRLIMGMWLLLLLLSDVWRSDFFIRSGPILHAQHTNIKEHFSYESQLDLGIHKIDELAGKTTPKLIVLLNMLRRTINLGVVLPASLVCSPYIPYSLTGYTDCTENKPQARHNGR